MGKLMSLIMTFIIALSSAVNPTTAGNWFIKHTNTHEQPVCDRQFSFIDDYDAYYIDPNADDEHKTIYLTFDAGYENGNIEKILDILKQENVPAAFFILDNLIYKNSDLLRRMLDDGHLICNHTTKHRDMSQTTEEEFKQELGKMEALFQERIGADIAKYYRPPEGKFAEENLGWAQEVGYTTVLWSFAYPDWNNEKQPDPAKTIRKILDNTHPGEILLLHPTSSTNAVILKDLIHEWRKMGYHFATLDDLTHVK